MSESDHRGLLLWLEAVEEAREALSGATKAIGEIARKDPSIERDAELERAIERGRLLGLEEARLLAVGQAKYLDSICKGQAAALPEMLARAPIQLSECNRLERAIRDVMTRIRRGEG